MASPIFLINPVEGKRFLYSLDEVFYVRETSSGGSVITNRLSTAGVYVIESVDVLISYSGLELVKFTELRSGDEMAVNRSKVSRVKEDESGRATIVLETEESFDTVELFNTLVTAFAEVPAGAVSGVPTIYTADSNIIDPTREVGVQDVLNFNLPATGQVMIGIPGGKRLFVDPDNDLVKVFGMDVEIEDNTKGIIQTTPDGLTRYRSQMTNIGVLETSSL